MPIPELIVLGNFLRQRPTGVQRYAIELTRALAARNPGRVILLAPPGVPIPPALADLSVERASCWGAAGGRLPGWAFLDAPAYLRLRGVGRAVVWNPSNIGAPHVPNQVITLHDLSFFRYPAFFSRSFRLKHQLACALSLPRALAVTTVSAAVRQEIEERFPFLRGRVSVVPNGVSSQFVRADDATIGLTRRKHGLPAQYFLTLGSQDPRKNVKTLIAAYRDREIHHRTGTALVLAGGKFPTFSDDPGLAKLLSVPGVIHLGYVPDSDLPALYSGARAFFLPSLYEGFGIPLIEALACGTPAYCSDLAVFREIAGDLARYFPPQSIAAVGAALDAAASAGGEQEGDARLEIARRYSWEKAAGTFEAVLRSLRPESARLEPVQV